MSDTDGGQRTTPALLAFTIANLASIVVHMGVALGFAIKRRRAWPFTGRNLSLVATCTVPIVTQACVEVARTYFNRRGPCVLQLVTFSAMLLFMPAVFLRAYRVYFLYMAACEKVASVQAYAKPKLWYTFRTHWVSTKRLMLVLLLWCMIFVFPGYGVYSLQAADPDYPTLAPNCQLQAPLSMVVGAVILFIIVGGVLLWKMRKVDDGFYIRLELRALLLIMVVLGVAQGLTQDDRWIANALAMLGAHVVLFLTLTLMAILSFKDEGMNNRYAQKRARRKRKQRGSLKAGCNSGKLHPSLPDSKNNSQTVSATHSIDGLSLSQVLDERDLTTLFVNHLKREFAVEYILLYQAARRFRERCTLSQNEEAAITEETDLVVMKSARGFSSTAQRNLRAAAIYRDFIAPDSRLEVPLPHMTIESIQSELSECISDFDIKPSSKPGASSDSPAVNLIGDDATLDKSVSIPENVEFHRAVRDTIFEAAEEYVFKLMEKDSFCRFKKRFPKLMENIVTHDVEAHEKTFSSV